MSPIKGVYVVGIVAIICIAALGGVIGWLVLRPIPSVEKETIEIGATGCFTGAMAAEGKEGLEGVTMAVEEINAAGGLLEEYTVNVVSYDIGDFDPGMVSTAAIKLCTDDKVEAAFSCGSSSLTNFELAIYNENEVPYFVGTSAPETEKMIAGEGEDWPYIFSTMSSMAGYQTDLPIYLGKWKDAGLIELPTKKVAIITSDNPYSTYISDGLKENFLAGGWTVTVDEVIPLGSVLEWGAILAKIRADPPDVIVNTDYNPSNEAAFLHQFLENPTPSMIFLQYGPTLPEFIELTGDEGTGVLYNLVGGVFVDTNLAYVETRDKFKARWGYEPGYYGSINYWMVKWWAMGVEKAGTVKDHLAVCEAIDTIVLDTSGGHYEIDPTTRMVKAGEDYVPTLFFQIWEAERYCVAPDKFKQADFRNPPWL